MTDLERPPLLRWRDVVTVAALALGLTCVMAAPVIVAPQDRLFGAPIAGWHHDPYSAMAVLAGPVGAGVFSQPVTDLPGALLARIVGPVVAYNLIVLLSFPLSAVTAYLLARYLGLTRVAALMASLAYAFAPFHVAHAAYHPHIAQTQWLPLYVLALWRCLDAGTAGRVVMLWLATGLVVLSNFYAGLIAAVLTPVLAGAHWFVCRKRGTTGLRNLVLTAGGLLAAACAGLAYVWWAAPAVMASPLAFAFPREDLFRYSAKWWAYLVPPVVHPFLGPASAMLWDRAGVGVGLLENQVYVGWTVAGLAAAALAGWAVKGRSDRSRTFVPVLVITAAAAVLCSLSPERTVWGVTFVRPSSVIYELVPMFRAYARFGAVAQLMAILLAAIALDWGWRAGGVRLRVAVTAAVVLAAGEYLVWPPAMWRDVLPTPAHRWVATAPHSTRVLDCVPPGAVQWSAPWLLGERIVPLSGETRDCGEPDVAGKLAALGFTHVLLREESPAAGWFARGVPEGFGTRMDFPRSVLIPVTASATTVYTGSTRGFHPREFDGETTWRWMGADASWTVVNRSSDTVAASVAVMLWTVRDARALDVVIDGALVQRVSVDAERRRYTIGPLRLEPGGHELVFRSVEPPVVADAVLKNGDMRALSCAVGPWNWRTSPRGAATPTR